MKKNACLSPFSNKISKSPLDKSIISRYNTTYKLKTITKRYDEEKAILFPPAEIRRLV